MSETFGTWSLVFFLLVAAVLWRVRAVNLGLPGPEGYPWLGESVLMYFFNVIFKP